MILNEKLLNYKDYVIETGSQGHWTWRKWKSGIVELFNNNVQNTGLNLTKQSAGTYYGEGTSGTKTITLPFSLSDALYIGAQEIGSRSSGVYIYTVSVNGNQLSTEFRAFSSSSNAACGVKYYIVGRI